MVRDEEITKEHDLVAMLETKLGNEESKVIILEAQLQTSDFRIAKVNVTRREAKDKA